MRLHNGQVNMLHAYGLGWGWLLHVGASNAALRRRNDIIQQASFETVREWR